MEAVREYLLSVTAAAILCSCIGTFFAKKGVVSTLIKTLCGVFVSLTMLQPVINLSIPEFESNYIFYSADSKAITEEAVQSASHQKCQVIKQQAEAYVYDKAAVLGCDVAVSITLAAEEPYAPETAIITGKVSPYAKSQLSAWIESDLGISEEEQKWNS